MQLQPFYPVLSKFGSVLEKKVEKLANEQKEQRPDIYALCMG